VRLGKRTTRRGAIDKMVRFAEARAARLLAAPPLAAPSRPSLPLPTSGSSVAAVARVWPFEAEREVWSRRSWSPDDPSLVLAFTEGALFGGSFAWLREIAAGEPRPIVACDVFLHPAQVVAAARAGAQGIAPLMSAVERAGVSLEEVTSWAVQHGLSVLPLLEAVFSGGASSLALRSTRDPETFRPLPDDAVAKGEIDAFARCYVDTSGV
jgi:hypothetical protein